MHLRLGDLVIRRGDSSRRLFIITGFDGEYVILKGRKYSFITAERSDNLLRLNKKRNTYVDKMRRIK